MHHTHTHKDYEMKKPARASRAMSSLVYCCTLLLLLEPCWSSLSLEPSMKTAVKYINGTYIVSCSTDEYNDVVAGSFAWLKNSQLLSYKKSISLKSTQNSSMLIFNRITPHDSGEYTCTYQQDSVMFRLVVVSPISFVDTPIEQTIQENRVGTIKCPAKGDPLPNIMWKFQKIDLNPTNLKYEFLPDGLKIRNVSVEDKGTYTCRAFQMSPYTSMYQEKDIFVSVLHRPVHRKHPVHAKVNQAYGFVGGMVNLTCEAVAEPAANFSWFRQKHKSIPGKIIQHTHLSILQIVIANTSMFGDYKCRAQNDFGTLDQIITLSEGIQPPAPRNLSVKAKGSDFLELQLEPPFINRTVYEPHMMPTGYRFQYKVKGSGTKWDHSMVADFDDYSEDDHYPYILMGLAHNTKYEVRVATRNAAGLSDPTTPRTFTTLSLRASSVTSSAAATTISLSAILILLCLILRW